MLLYLIYLIINLWYLQGVGTLTYLSGKIDAVMISCLLYYPTDATALSNSYFGDGDGPYHLSGLNCRGEENTLLNCPRSSSTIGYHTCLPGNDAGVRCDGKWHCA
jgi:hypothetical protein